MSASSRRRRRERRARALRQSVVKKIVSGVKGNLPSRPFRPLSPIDLARKRPKRRVVGPTRHRLPAATHPPILSTRPGPSALVRSVYRNALRGSGCKAKPNSREAAKSKRGTGIGAPRRFIPWCK